MLSTATEGVCEWIIIKGDLRPYISSNVSLSFVVRLLFWVHGAIGFFSSVSFV